MFIALAWFILAIVIGAAASSRGRFGLGWFVLAILISPVIAGLMLAVFPDLRTRSLLERMVTVPRVDDRELARAAEFRGAPQKPRLLVGPAIFAALSAAIVALIVVYYSVDEPERTALVEWVGHISTK